MQATVSLLETQLHLLDEVVAGAAFGSRREEVIRRVALEHAAHILGGGGANDPAPWTPIEVERPAYGPSRFEMVLTPGVGKAVPVHRGEVLRLTQLVGGQCVDFNAYNLHDYKEYLDCGFNRQRGFMTGPGTVVWSGSPRGNPFYVIRDASESCDQFYAGHRCNGVMIEKEYGFVDHPSCQDAFAEAIREYRLTPDDTHDSYNFWMKTYVDDSGRRTYGHGRSVAGDYVELVSMIDTLAVPVCCPAEVNPINNYDPQPVQVNVHEATPETHALADFVHGHWGGLKAQKTPSDFKVREILADRELRPDPDYEPDFLPFPGRQELDVELSEPEEAMLHGLMRTGLYGPTEGKALLIAFIRWFDANRTRKRYAKLTFSDKEGQARRSA